MKSLIDDVYLDDDRDKGEPILFTNQAIRKMLRLAKVAKDDVFYDLGSGWGQNLILALTEANAAKVVGIEKDDERRKKALGRLDAWAKSRPEFKGRYSVILGDFERLLKDKLEGASLKEATVVFYGLSTYKALIEGIRNQWQDGTGNRRFVYYYRWLFPEILADARDYPFLVSEFPFKKPKSELEWLKSVVGKEHSSIRKGEPDEDELWDELTHDYDIDGNVSEIRRYESRLETVLTKQ
jgi:Histone methylation protein DOT1